MFTKLKQKLNDPATKLTGVAAQKAPTRRQNRLYWAGAILLTPPTFWGLYQFNPWICYAAALIGLAAAALIITTTRRRPPANPPESWSQIRQALERDARPPE